MLQIIFPLRAYNYLVRIVGKQIERTVFAMDEFTISDDKQLVVELNEKSGGRHQSFVIENSDIINTRVIDELRIN